MCGIAGLVMPVGRPVDRSSLEAMTGCLRHRGPDAGGLHVETNVGLGHRRLAVIDPASEAANQPLFNEDGTVAVTFNGEIYNFRALRRDLESRGHTFRTRCDTEIIVHAWEEFGPACVERFRGMFAFAIADFRQRRMFLARDRLGKKPLFYAIGLHEGDARAPAFAFGSEIKALLALPGFPRRDLDAVALRQFITYGNSLGPRTIFTAVRKLPPGHQMLLDLDDPANPRIERYWQPVPAPDNSVSESEWLERLDATISEAVKLRLVSDVPLGAFLSGGIDSSLIVAYMARHASGPVKTFTIGFAESAFDESPYAALVARHLGTEHHCEIVKPDAVTDLLPHLVRAYDEPFADSSAIPTYHLARMTRRNVTVALSGDGGDELFYGYRRYRYAAVGGRVTTLLTPLGRGVAAALAEMLPRGASARTRLQQLSLCGPDLYGHHMGYQPDRLALLRPEFAHGDAIDAAARELADEFGRHPGLSMAGRCRYSDVMHYLPDDILVKVDRASMQHALEVRCPLLDHEVAELAMRIPPRMHMSGTEGKRLLRKLAGRYLPEEILNRPKKGFGVPLAAWFKDDLAPTVQATIDDATHPTWDYLDRAVAQETLDQHLAGRGRLHETLWRLLFFSFWADAYLRVESSV